MRNASTQPVKAGSQAPPVEAIFQTLPSPVTPSPVQRLPSRSKASPFVPGTPVAKAVAVGGVVAFGAVTFQTVPVPAASATYRVAPSSKGMPEGLQATGFGMKPTTVCGGDDGAAELIFHTGQGAGAAARPVV